MEKKLVIRVVALAMILVAVATGAATAAETAAEPASDEGAMISPTKEFPRALGVFGSSMNGGGLSYQSWNSDLGFAVAAGAFAIPASGLQFGENTASTDVMNYGYNIEANLLYRLFASNFWNWLSGDLLVYASVAYKGAQTADYIYDPDKDETTDDSYYREGTLEQSVAAGLGIGYEIVLFRHFSLPLQFGYQVEWPFLLDFCFSGGLRYRFR